MNYFRSITALFVAAIITLIDGCSGGGSTPPPPSPPVISSFASNPASGFGGQTCTLSWVVSGASSIAIDSGIGDVTSVSSKVVYPLSTTTYTLTASNAGGSHTASTTIAINDSIVIPPSTKVLDQTTTQNLSNISQNGSVLTFSQSSSTLQNLKFGDSVVLGVTNATPNGLLRKVTSVTQNGSQIIVNTGASTIEEIISKCDFAASKVLTPSDVAQAVSLTPGISLEPKKGRKNISNPQATASGFYIELNNVVLYDEDNNLQTTNDQIIGNGSITLNPSFNFVLKVSDSSVKELSYSTTLNETVDIDVSAKLSKSVDKKFEIPGARWYFQPIVVMVGWLPVVIQPVLTVNVGINGEIFAGVTAGVIQQATLTYGLSYINGQWAPISSLTNTFQWNPPELTAGCNFKAFLGPQFNLSIYGIIGPYGEARGYLNLDADIFRTPWWQIFGGLEADVGVRVEILGKKIINDYEFPAAIGYRRLLAQATTPYLQPGTVSGSVKNAITNTGLSGVSINVYKETNLLATSMSNAAGAYAIPVPAGSGYKIEFIKSGFLSTTYNDVTVQANLTTFLEVVLQIDTAHAGNGAIGGKIVNAFNGSPVGGLTLKLRAGINATSGTVISTTGTNSSGQYSVANLPAGNYTLEMSGTGFNTAFMTAICVGNTTTGNQDGSITPILASGETRIILTWGEIPYDLDSHLTGPVPSSADRFHVFFADRTFSFGGTTYADLDLDDTYSYGPETVTIREQTLGVYRYSVYNYSNGTSTNSTDLSLSNATVRVYRGNNLVATFNVPNNRGGTLWTVFELNGNTITPINTMSYQGSSWDVPIVSKGGTIVTDSELIFNHGTKSK